MDPFDNSMRRALRRLDRFPKGLAARLRSFVLGRTVRFVGTAGLVIEVISPEQVVVRIDNRRPVQNHIGTIHAAAMALLAETATGFAVGMHVHDGAVPVIKHMGVDYLRRAKGGLRAVARLSPEDQKRLHEDERGEVLVPVTVTDSEGQEPIRCEMVWAWTARRR